jgi:hypothetical protein
MSQKRSTSTKMPRILNRSALAQAQAQRIKRRLATKYSRKSWVVSSRPGAPKLTTQFLIDQISSNELSSDDETGIFIENVFGSMIGKL